MSAHPISSQITAPSVEPMTTAEAKLYLRVDTSADDTLIAGLITAARVWVERYTRRSLCTQTIDQTFPLLPAYRRPIILAAAPLASVTSISYIDPDGVTQTLDSSLYVVKTLAGATAGRGWIEAATDASMPDISTSAELPVTVRAVCGYGAAAAVPDGIKAAIYLLLGDLYEQRQETMTTTSQRTQTTVERLLAPYRLLEIS